MQRAALALLLAACGTTPRSPVAAPFRPPDEPAVTPAGAAAVCDHGLEATPLPGSTRASWGSTRPALALTSSAGGLRAWFPAGWNDPFHTARIDENGTLGPPVRADGPFTSLGEVDYPAIVATGDAIAAVASVYVTSQNADLFVAFERNGEWSRAVPIRANADLDHGVVVAPRSNGGVAVAWSTGAYPMAPDIAFALVSADGRVEEASVLARDEQPEGMALVPLPDGRFMLVYTPSSVLHQEQRGVVAMIVSASGTLEARKVALRGPALWPVAAWDGDGVAIAVRWEGGEPNDRRESDVRFLRVDGEGNLLGEPVLADRHDDPLAGFRPAALLPIEGGYFLASSVGFSASVIVAGPSEARVVRLDATGHPVGPALPVTHEHGVNGIDLATTPRGLFVAYIEGQLASSEERLRIAAIGCRRGPASSPAAPSGPCDPRVEPIPDGVFGELRGLFEVVPLESDMLVGHRLGREPRHRIARLGADGAARWDVELSGETWNPKMTVQGGVVAVVVSVESGGPKELVLLDAATGRQTLRRRLVSDASEHCLAPHPRGFLTVLGAPYDARQANASAVVVARDGTPGAPVDLGTGITGCDLMAVGDGYLLAFTRVGRHSETNYLWTMRLDGRGAPLGDPRRVEDVSFARGPTLTRDGDRTLLAFTGPISREVWVVELDALGAARGEVREVARTYGLLGLGWSAPAELLWSTQRGELGRARLCPGAP